MRMTQCRKCPWRKGVNPRDVPNGYCEQKHRDLESTIANDQNLADAIKAVARRELPMMACHESKVGSEEPCVGWLANQLGPGNNIALRLMFSRAVKNGEVTGALKLIGDQHECFEDTLPKKRKRKR